MGPRFGAAAQTRSWALSTSSFLLVFRGKGGWGMATLAASVAAPGAAGPAAALPLAVGTKLMWYWGESGGFFIGWVIESRDAHGVLCTIPPDEDGMALVKVKFEDGDERLFRAEDVLEGVALLAKAPPIDAPNPDHRSSRYIHQQVTFDDRTLTITRVYESRPDLTCGAAKTKHPATFICEVS
mmetsp:Transcript_68298/g.189703  ORF Transcript_68298/g.189703 Transcript_68298/m.189703 type:complete len:183 (-) Transcript_68298:248-796(-)